jgi:phytoene synthase
MAYEIERNRALYAYADTGIALLPARSARCIGTARVLYARILDRIEAQHLDVFTQRARVPMWRKAATAARILAAGPPAAMKPAGRKAAGMKPQPRQSQSENTRRNSEEVRANVTSDPH